MSAPNFAIRIAHAARGGRIDAGTDADLSARLQRMARKGWSVSTPRPGIDAATTGHGTLCQTGDMTLCGMAWFDNRAALLARLGLAEDESPSDLELAARLRLAEGPGFVTVLSGSFAFVVLPDPGGRVEGYRDHLGVYPLCYALHDGALTCGSDPRAVLHLSGVPLEANPVRIADYILAAEVDPSQTVFSGLKRLPAAHRLTAGPDRVETTAYWTLTAKTQIAADRAPEALRDALRTATDLRTDMDTIAAMLSGGLDSSSLSGLANQAARQKGFGPLRTLSFVYPDKQYDESRYIDAANAAYGSRPHFIAITAPPDISVLKDIVEEQMELSLAAGLMKSRRIYHEASTLGLTHLIDGHGGDEVISLGRQRLTELAAGRRFSALYANMTGLSETRDAAFWGNYLGWLAVYGGWPPRSIVRRILGRLSRLLSPRPGEPEGMRLIDLLAPDLREQISSRGRYEFMIVLKTHADFLDAERLTHINTLQSPLIQHAFEELHRTASAAGIEPRYPFYDRHVVELSVAMPSQVKMHRGQTRWVLKEAMKGILPEIIRTRNDKADFGSEIREALVTHYRTQPETCFDVLAPFVNVRNATELRRNVLDGSPRPQDVSRLWKLTLLTFWMQALQTWRSQQAQGTLI